MTAYPKNTKSKSVKKKICKVCKQELSMDFFSSTRARICHNCKVQRHYDQKKAMMQRQIERLKTKKQKTKGVIRISDLKKKAQKVFNKYIRLRDADKPCISCGKIVKDKEAGHYIAQGSSGNLRYDEFNVHGQCKACNRWKHGNLIEYRIGLIKRIGEPMVDGLEKLRHQTKKWTREELKEIISCRKEQIKNNDFTSFSNFVD